MEIIKRSDHAQPRVLDGRRQRHALRALYPGLFLPVEQPVTLNVLVEAAGLIDPDAIVVGAGARLLGWAAAEAHEQGRAVEAPMPLRLASRRRLRGESAYLAFEHRTIPEEFVVDRGEVRFTMPEFTAVDLIPEHGAAIVDEVLRLAGDRSADSLRLMWEALAATPRRRGNARRQQVLHSSRDRPWSEGERQLHGLLRRWHLSGWVANHHVIIGGRHWFLDVAFPELKVALEFDSREFHGGAGAFENDRQKLNDLEVEGWRVLQVTWRMLQEPAQIRQWLRALIPRAD